MPHKETGRRAASIQHDDPGDGHGTLTTVYHYTIRSYGGASRSLLDELVEAPLIPLAALLLSDATPHEIAARLRLNFAIRLLLDAIREADCAGAS
jgi:hypothetical protein